MASADGEGPQGRPTSSLPASLHPPHPPQASRLPKAAGSGVRSRPFGCACGGGWGEEGTGGAAMVMMEAGSLLGLDLGAAP